MTEHAKDMTSREETRGGERERTLSGSQQTYRTFKVQRRKAAISEKTTVREPFPDTLQGPSHCIDLSMLASKQGQVV